MSSLYITNTAVFEQNPLRLARFIYPYRWNGSVENFIDNKAQDTTEWSISVENHISTEKNENRMIYDQITIFNTLKLHSHIL